MTIARTLSRWEYDGDGSTVTFPYTNKIFVDADLNVYVDAVLQTLTTDYTVTGAGDDNGSVVFVTPPANGTDIIIVRSLTDDQQTDLPAGGAFPAESVEDMSDRRTIISQQQQEEIDRCLKIPVSDTSSAQSYDGGGLEIENIAQGDATTSAANVGQVNALIAAATLGTLSEAVAYSVDSLTELQGVATGGFSGDELRYMSGRSTTGDGGEGVFIWRTGDKSTEVAADEVTASGGNGGVWIAPTSDLTGASGAWERVGFSAVDASWYGVTTNGDALSQAIAYSKANGFIPIDLPAGTITLTAELPQVNTTFNSPIIRGAGIGATTIDISGLAADSRAFFAIGGSGGLTAGYLADMTIQGSGTQWGRECRGHGGWDTYRVKYSNLLHATVWSNDVSGGFTEYSQDIDGEVDVNVSQPWLYKRGIGNDSFHGSGFRQMVVNNDTTSTSPTVKVGDTGDSGDLKVYNAPWDMQLFTRATYTVFDFEAGITPIVSVHGTLTIERFAGTQVLAATGTVHYCGNILLLGSSVTLGTLKQCVQYVSNTDGSSNVMELPRRFVKDNGGGTTINLDVADEMSNLLLVNFFAGNYDYKYLLLVEKDNYGGAGSATVLANHNAFNSAGYGAPTFSVDASGNVTATNGSWSGNTINCFVYKFGQAGRNAFFGTLAE